MSQKNFFCCCVYATTPPYKMGGGCNKIQKQTHKQGEKMIKLNNKFKMTNNEIEQYNLLPDNLPENKLKPKQIEFINDLYYNYITLNIDN